MSTYDIDGLTNCTRIACPSLDKQPIPYHRTPSISAGKRDCYRLKLAGGRVSTLEVGGINQGMIIESYPPARSTNQNTRKSRVNFSAKVTIGFTNLPSWMAPIAFYSRYPSGLPQISLPLLPGTLSREHGLRPNSRDFPNARRSRRRRRFLS